VDGNTIGLKVAALISVAPDAKQNMQKQSKQDYYKFGL
jgi:hypothetical protein